MNLIITIKDHFCIENVTQPIAKFLKKIMPLPVLFSMLIALQSANSYSQVQRPNMALEIDSSLTKLKAGWQFYHHNKFIYIDSSFILVMNAEGEPIKNARIILSNDLGFGDTISQHGHDGLYFLNSELIHGVYRLEVSATGYETHVRHFQTYPQTRCRITVALGKPGDYYLPDYFPISNPKEAVTFTMKKPYKDAAELEIYMAEFRTEVNKLRRMVNPDDTIYLFNNCMQWPADSLKRIEFRDAIQQSEILKTYTLQVLGGCSNDGGAFINSIDFWIDSTVSEKTIRTVLERNNFSIYRLQRGYNTSTNRMYWNIYTTYDYPLSKDLLVDIREVNLALPVIMIDVDSLVGAKNN
ncbi:MAG: hypothetical protein GC181_10150 [Bacteroidetes bacterium]|nr:hypothetical protein [Bacteroidota bacterium]